jgi:hypothetical protein
MYDVPWPRRLEVIGKEWSDIQMRNRWNPLRTLFPLNHSAAIRKLDEEIFSSCALFIVWNFVLLPSQLGNEADAKYL